MTPRDLSTITDAEIDAEIEQLKHAAAIALDPCTTAKLIALSDASVRTLFAQKCRAGFPFVGIECLAPPSIPENVYVYFDFDCMPNTLCLIRPSFLVTVNLITTQVVPPIRDPYVPSAFGPQRRGRNVRQMPSSHRCDCISRSKSLNDPVADLADIIGNVLGRGITCAIVNRRCGNDQRCNRSFRKLENFHDNPTAETARELADFMGASSMQEKCVRAIIEEADTVDWLIFVAAVAAAAAA